MADEKKLDILSPEAKKWLENQLKGRAELSTEDALHKERMDNAFSEYQRYISDVYRFMRATGTIRSAAEYDRQRNAILEKYGIREPVGNSVKYLGRAGKQQLGSEDIDQAPYRPFRITDINLYGDWAEQLDNHELNYIRMVLSEKLNEKYFGSRGGRPLHYSRLGTGYYRDYAGRSRKAGSRYDPSRGHMWGLRTEGAPTPKKGADEDPTHGGVADDLGNIKLSGGKKLNMNDIWKNINMTGGIETIERYARRGIEEERYAGTRRGIEEKFQMGQYEPRTGKAIAESAFDKSELEAAKTLKELEGRTMDSPPLRFEPDTAESQEQRFERQRREENNKDKLRRLRELEEENRRRRREAIN